jgi:cytochrome b561
MVRNTADTWGWPARALHWIVAVLVLGIFTHGLMLDDFPREARGYQLWLHAAAGASLFAFGAAGFAWWLINTVPRGPPGTPGWQLSAARIVHWALYVLLFGTLTCGWLLAGTHRTPVDVQMFGLLTMPQPLAPHSPLHKPLEETHAIVAYLLITLVALHVAAALYHHFALRDEVLARMITGRTKVKRPVKLRVVGR